MNLDTSERTRHWWAEIKADPDKLLHWLQKQYHGEVSAGERIATYLLAAPDLPAEHQRTLRIMEAQEKRHASWIAKLLSNRNIIPETPPDVDRYWRETLPGVKNFAECAAVAAQAESMRLGRIALIASDVEAPQDIRETFQKILPEEQFHVRAFAAMSNDEALAKTAPAHLQGLLALGLITPEMV